MDLTWIEIVIIVGLPFLAGMLLMWTIVTLLPPPTPSNDEPSSPSTTPPRAQPIAPRSAAVWSKPNLRPPPTSQNVWSPDP